MQTFLKDIFELLLIWQSQLRPW